MFIPHFFVLAKRCGVDDVVASEMLGILLPKSGASEEKERQPLVWR